MISESIVFSALLAVGADVGLAEAFYLCTLVMEPFLALPALNVDQIRVHRHLANTVLLPKLRRWHQSFLLVQVISAGEVVVLVGGHHFAVLVLSQHEALAFYGLDVQAKVEIFGREDLCLRDVFAVLVEQGLGEVVLFDVPLHFDEG